jgi:hypothetical protein
MDVPQEPPDPDADPATEKPVENHLVVLDRTGNVLRSRRELGVESIFPVGDRAFVAMSGYGEATSLRVFDLAKLDWAGPALHPARAILDVLTIGDHAVVLGAGAGGAEDAPMPLVLATLDAGGALSPWKPIDLTASEARLVSAAAPDTGLLLALQPGENRDQLLRTVAFDAELSISPASPATPAPIAGLGSQILVTPDAIYNSSWGIPDRFACDVVSRPSRP